MHPSAPDPPAVIKSVVGDHVDALSNCPPTPILPDPSWEIH